MGRYEFYTIGYCYTKTTRRNVKQYKERTCAWCLVYEHNVILNPYVVPENIQKWTGVGYVQNLLTEDMEGWKFWFITHCPKHVLSIWCDFDRASSLICGNKMPTRCNTGFYCRSYCLLNMFRASLRPSSGAQEYYTVVAACGILCCGFFK